ncbi:uncharacterized protein METZ01_LOCUS110718 [marine metagenome]|uniref:Glycosyl transferase family 1 domain-containing protein n=1 Tax=marine metagenome TaxID=408172 RepID=A0A381WZG2_9ZZZZ
MQKILILQRKLEHYRLDVFQALSKRDSINLTVAFPHIRDHRQHKVESLEDFQTADLKVKHLRWPVLDQEFFIYTNWRYLLEIIKPDALVAEANPRVINIRNIMNYCKSNGIQTIAWTKYDNSSKWPNSFIWRNLLSDWDRILCYGEQSRDGLVEMGIPISKLSVAQNTVEIPLNEIDLDTVRKDAFEITSWIRSDDLPLVVSLGTLVKKKRFDEVIEVSARLMNAGTQFRLAVVGGGPKEDELKVHAQKILSRFCIPADRIVFVGRVPEGHDRIWLSAADVTLMGGAVGLALNVSMGCGTATIIPDEKGSDAELLEHSINGIRFKCGDQFDLQEKLKTLLNDATLRKELGEKARITILEKATIQKMVDGFIEAATMN